MPQWPLQCPWSPHLLIAGTMSSATPFLLPPVWFLSHDEPVDTPTTHILLFLAMAHPLPVPVTCWNPTCMTRPDHALTPGAAPLSPVATTAPCTITRLALDLPVPPFVPLSAQQWRAPVWHCLNPPTNFFSCSCLHGLSARYLLPIALVSTRWHTCHVTMTPDNPL